VIQPSNGSTCAGNPVAGLAGRPGGLHQAQHGVQPVSGRVGDQAVALGVAGAQAQPEAGASLLQRVEQVLAGRSVARASGCAVVALVRAAPISSRASRPG
jgi:hypothetical protein